MKKEQKRKISKEEKGITLIALVITIIILLILAGVTLNAALSENGLFKKAKYAAEEYNKKAIEEEIQLIMAEAEMDSIINGTNQSGDITDVLEKVKESEGPITEKDIQDFNEKYLEGYDKKIEAVPSNKNLNELEPNGFYVQTGDITIPEDYTPLGEGTVKEDGSIQSDDPFTGVYDGNGHTIESLNITDEDGCAGMFGVNEGTVKNIKIKNCNVTSKDEYVGAIAGVNNGLIENCEVSGSVSVNQTLDASAVREVGRNLWKVLWKDTRLY